MIFGSGRQMRDFVFVSDVVQALLLSLKGEKATGKTINIGTGKPTSIKELARSVNRLFGYERFSVVRKPTRKVDIQHSSADLTLARDFLAFSPKVELTDGVRMTIGPKSERSEE